MKTFEIDLNRGGSIIIDEVTFEEGGVMIKFTGEFPKGKVNNYHTICAERVYTDDDYELVKEVYGIIPFHPECEYGECSTCHNYSCGIYQGYNPEPTWDECEHRERLIKRLKPDR